VTRTRQQSSQLAERLQELGAAVIEAPTIQIEPVKDLAAVDQAVQDIQRFDWLVLTSANGVDALAEALDRLSLDSRHLSGVRFAVVGDATNKQLCERLGIRADLQPDRATGAALAATLIASHDMTGRRVCLFRAEIARPDLAERLSSAGATVLDLPVYRTRRVDALPEHVVAALQEGRVDWLTFTSSSTARNLVERVGQNPWLSKLKIASSGPMTSATIRDLGLTVTVEADAHDIAGLARAICESARP